MELKQDEEKKRKQKKIIKLNWTVKEKSVTRRKSEQVIPNSYDQTRGGKRMEKLFTTKQKTMQKKRNKKKSKSDDVFFGRMESQPAKKKSIGYNLRKKNNNQEIK